MTFPEVLHGAGGGGEKLSQAAPDVGGDTPDRQAAGDLQGLCIVRIRRAPPILEETRRWEITDLGVRESARRRGIGTRLVDEALAWLGEAGVARVQVQVAAPNAAAQAFWRARGFQSFMDVLHKRL